MNTILPMTIPVHSEYSGMINYEHPAITIEYKKWSSTESMYKVIITKFLLQDILEIIILDRGIFETRIDFVMKSLKLIEEIPNIHGKIIMQFKLKYKKEALRWARFIKNELLHMKMVQIDSELDKLENQ